MSIQKVFIAGSGLMGSGIAQVCAQAGIEVFLTDVSRDIVDRALKNISWSVGKLIEKGNIREPLEIILGRIETGIDLALAARADLAIEAVFERLDLKEEIFRRLDETCPSQDISRDEYFRHSYHGACSRHETARKGSGTSLLQPGADDGGRGGDQGGENVRGDDGGRRSIR